MITYAAAPAPVTAPHNMTRGVAGASARCAQWPVADPLTSAWGRAA
jgi:hypothetical protein